MASKDKRRKRRNNSTSVDSECMKKLNLLHVCGYCSKLMEDDKEVQLEHALSHKTEITQCRSCCLPIQLNEKESHLKKVHCHSHRFVKFDIDKSLIEIRIAAGKGYSNFWGVSLHSSDPALQNFRRVTVVWWNNFKSGRSLGCFRVIKSKILWNCPVCLETSSSATFNETISMRAYALSHLEQNHYNEMIENVPGFLDFEWFHLQEEADFDIRSLMDLATQRSKIPSRSFFTFYTVDLSLLENGDKLMKRMQKVQEIEDKEVRYCLICCCLVPIESIRSHFRSHSHLKPVAESTSFTKVDNKQENVFRIEEERSDGTIEVKTGMIREEDEEENFEFPRELFLYEKVYKNLNQDVFKWRCCLCPRAHAQTFATQIIMRMHALRHIDEKHKFLFTEEFLAFEWLSVKHEMRASFDIRKFTPMDYTEKGEGTFNNRDPNDYMLPQQYYFLPKDIALKNVICGFCYRSFQRNEFLPHISIHGFGVLEEESCQIRPVVLNQAVRELMGQQNYSDNGLGDEPANALSVDGKRLKSKMELANDMKNLRSSICSELMTPMKSETDGEMNTPRRKSAMDARKLLADTFKILQENARNRNDTWNESSCSSSSDEDNSEDDLFEKQIELEERKNRSVSSMSVRKKNAWNESSCSSSSENDKSQDKLFKKQTELEKRKTRIVRSVPVEKKRKEKQKTGRRCISKMKPAELQSWIQKEAEKRGIEWKDSDSSSSDSESDAEETKRVNSKWSDMKPDKIKQLIRNAAKRKKIAFSNGSSSSSSSDNDDD